MTRRMVRGLWQGIIKALDSQVKLNQPQAAHASAEIYVGDSLLAVPRSDDRRLLAPLYARMLELARDPAPAGAAR